MFDTSSLLIFAAAAFALVVVPGTAVLFIVARSIEQGRTAGLVSMLGINVGAVIHVLFAALGLSAVLAQSALAFNTIKWLGALYLIYLGIRTLMGEVKSADIQTITPKPHRQLFTQGIIVNVLNPKSALFFFAFLPQFVNPERGSATLQIIILGTIFIGIALVSDAAYALAAGTVRDKLAGNLKMMRAQKMVSGLIYIGLGILTAVSGKNS